MATRERRKFTPEFKREAVKLAEQRGRSLAAVARELGVARTMLKLWVDNFAAGRYEKDRALPLKAAQQMENEQLRRELAKVRMERDILDHLGEPTTPPRIAPARGPPLWEATGAAHDPAADPLLQSAPAFEFDQRLRW